MRTKNRKKWLICVLTLLCMICGALAVGLSEMHADALEPIRFSIDTLGYGRSDLPDGYVGKSYPVFEYTATDGAGQRVTDTQVTVFGPSNTILPIKNGRFDTETEGQYTIEYTARKGDVVATEIMQINVLPESEYSAPSYSVNSEIVDSADTGSMILLPDGNVNEDNVSVNVSVKYKSGSYSCEPIIEDGAEIAYFVPETEGIYSVVYTVTDFVGGCVKTEKEITVSDSGLPVLRVPSVSKVAHVGEASKYPVAEAVLYREGKQMYVPVKTSVENQDITQTMTYTPEQAGKYTVTYTAANIYDTDKITVSKHIVTAYGELGTDTAYVARFFAFDNMTMAYRSESETLENYVATLSAVSAGESSTFDFKNPVREEYLSVSLGSDGADSSFGAIRINFIDSKHADERICIMLKENDDKKIEVYLNGRKVADLNKTFTDEIDDYSQSSFTVKYAAKNKALIDENGEIITAISSYANGKVFRGFTSKSAYLTVELQDVTEKSRIKLYRIAGQTISDTPVDSLDPMFIYGDAYLRTQNADIGQRVTVGYIETFDLFDTAPTLTATITSPTGKTVYSGDITSVYSFTAEEYGVYSVKYVARDSAGREKSARAIVQVIDRIAPEITINGVLSGNVETGKEYTLSTSSVTDNYSKECTSWISIAYENSAEEFVQNGKYVFRKSGIYTVTYGAMDAAGNRTLVSYTVECK